MKVYKVTRKIEVFEVDENKLLKTIKEHWKSDEDVQKAKDLDELAELFGGIQDFDNILDELCTFDKIHIKTRTYYNVLTQAFDEYDWGIH